MSMRPAIGVRFAKQVAHVRFGSLADIEARPINVRFTPESGHRNSVVECPLCAKADIGVESKFSVHWFYIRHRERLY